MSVTQRNYCRAWIVAEEDGGRTRREMSMASIVARAWATYQQLLKTHPWKTQTIETGKKEKSNKLNETAKTKKHKQHPMRKLCNIPVSDSKETAMQKAPSIKFCHRSQ